MDENRFKKKINNMHLSLNHGNFEDIKKMLSVYINEIRKEARYEAKIEDAIFMKNDILIFVIGIG